jgi:hypothetical protein
MPATVRPRLDTGRERAVMPRIITTLVIGTLIAAATIAGHTRVICGRRGRGVLAGTHRRSGLEGPDPAVRRRPLPARRAVKARTEQIAKSAIALLFVVCVQQDTISTATFRMVELFISVGGTSEDFQAS